MDASGGTSSKSALLARIKAAQEKARKFDPYAEDEEHKDKIVTPQDTAEVAAPTSSAADALEDLFGFAPSTVNADATNDDTIVFNDTNVCSQPSQQHVEDTFEEILGLEGLSEADRRALLEEQRRILDAIQNKNQPQNAAADAFESRSLSHVVGSGSSGIGEHRYKTDAELAQMAADEELAQQLQKEEYKQHEESQQRRRQRQQLEQEQQAESGEQGWLEWLGITGPAPGTGPSGPPPSFAQPVPRRGEIGMSLPPGATRSPGSPPQTETISFSQSYDEQDRLMTVDSPHGRTPARVAAKPTSVFSCVADSVTQAANSLSETLQTTHLWTDGEGNVHGVDASGLLGGGDSSSSYNQLQDRDH